MGNLLLFNHMEIGEGYRFEHPEGEDNEDPVMIIGWAKGF
jgi:hypothetical protein